jgi:hypothetical protein
MLLLSAAENHGPNVALSTFIIQKGSYLRKNKPEFEAPGVKKKH